MLITSTASGRLDRHCKRPSAARFANRRRRVPEPIRRGPLGEWARQMENARDAGAAARLPLVTTVME